MQEKLKESNNNKNNDFLNSDYSISSINPGEKILAVNFVSMENQDIGHYNLICKNIDLLVNLEARLYKDFPQFKDFVTFFTVNGSQLKDLKQWKKIKLKIMM